MGLAEATCERDVLLGGQLLVPEEEHDMLEQGIA
jgi:hypothetical protein